jgi:uncharacterized membrane protein YccC
VNAYAGALGEALRAWVRQDGARWLFVLRTFLSVVLALAISFRFDLAAPSTAMTTVFVVAAPSSGDVLAKSFYRALATFVGGAVGVLLVGAFVEQREVFVALLALWIAVCTFGAAYLRGFRSYAFVLSGYTAALIAIPSIGNAEQVFDTAVLRVSEVLVGILSTGVVSELVFPQPASETLRRSVRAAYAGFVQHLRDTLSARGTRRDYLARSQGHAALTLALELQREAAFFESPETRARSERLRRFGAGYGRAGSALNACGAAYARVRRRDPALAGRFEDSIAGLAEALVPAGAPPASAAEALPTLDALQQLRARLPAQLQAQRAELVEPARQLDFDTLAELFLHLLDELVEFTRDYAALRDTRGLDQSRPAPAFVPHTDALDALVMGLRALLIMIALTSFWIATDWPSGSSATIIASVFCALFGTLPRPERAVREITVGFGIGAGAVLLCKFAVLPRVDGFPALCAVLAPFLMVSLYATMSPSIGGIARGVNLLFSNALGLQNLMGYDVAATLNDALAQLAGCAAAAVAFTAIIPSFPALFAQRFERRLRRYAVRACCDPLDGLAARFDSGLRDLNAQLVARVDAGRGQDLQLTACALAVNDVGHAVLRLRQTLAQSTTTPHSEALRQILSGALAGFLDQPEAARRAQLLEPLATLEAQFAAPEAQRLRWHLRRLRAILADAPWYADFTAEPAAGPEEQLHAT